MDPLVQLAELVRGAADREAFDLLATQPALIGRLAADDYAVGAAVVREAAQRADATAPAVIDLVTRLSDHLVLPATASLGADSASYVDALIAWYTAIQASGFKSLKEGQQVEFEAVKGPKGMQASNVKPK